ncbi:MAG: hypothetical protein ACRERC_01600 [Candidatus Binatia bacterium]
MRSEAAGSGAGAQRRLAWALLIMQCAAVVLVLGWRFPQLWAERWAQDDAYVSFRYARNLVRGHGLVYNVGEPVEGYTNFLWTVLAAVPLAQGADDPLPFMHVVSAGLWWASYALLLALAIGLWRAGVWAAPLALVPLALHWSFNMWFLSGMETPLVTFLTIAAVCLTGLDPLRHRWSLFGVSLACVLLTMTRPDGVVVFAALGLAIVLLDGRRLWRARRWGWGLLAPALPLLLLYLPFQAWRVWYYGSFFPNTYYAKVAYLTYYPRGWKYLRSYADIYHLRPFLLPLLLGALCARADLPRRFLCAALLASAAVAFYVVRLGGDFMEWRFLTPVSAVFYVAVVVAAASIAQWLAAWRGAPARRVALGGWMVGGLAALLLGWATFAATPGAMTRAAPDGETIALLRRYLDPGRYDWRSAALVFDSVLPRDAHIATTSAGIVPYVCDRPCLDLHGLTDAQIARTPVDPANRGRTGHEHWLQDYGEMRRRGVDAVLEWADPHLYARALTQPPQDGRELVSVRLADGRFVDFTLLDAALAPALRDDPRLVFYDPARIANRRRFHARKVSVAGLTLIDELDWGDGESEQTHGFSESQPPDAPYQHSWHTKLLAYAPPFETVRLEDNGRRIFGSAEWTVHNVAAARDLVLLGRHDHTGAARFTVEVNGRPVSVPLVTLGRPDELWGEALVRIPKALLVDGDNRIRIVRRPESERDAEWYYMWFLQERGEGVTGDQPLPKKAEGNNG